MSPTPHFAPALRTACAFAGLIFCAAPAVSWGSAQGVIASGELRTGSVAAGGANDTYTFTANTGDGIFITVGDVNAAANFYPRIRLANPDATSAGSSFGQSSTRIETTATQTGTFTLTIDDNYTTTAGSYRLTVVIVPATPVVSGGDEGGPATSNLTYTGSLSPGDADVWTMTLAIGDTIVAEAGEVVNGSPIQPALRIYAPNGSTAQSDPGSVSAARVQFRATTAGTHTVLVYDPNNTGAAGDYRLTVINTRTVGAPSGGDEGGPVTSGAYQTGSLDVGDGDAFTFNANSGANLLVSFGDTGAGANFYPRAVIFAPDGSQLTSTFNQTEARLDVTAPATGSYTLLLDENYRSGSGTYGFSVMVGGATHTTSVGDEGGAASSGGSHTGTIVNGDIDVWTINAASGDTLFGAIGKNTAGAAWSPGLRLLDPNGVVVQSDTGSGSAARVQFRATTAGLHTFTIFDQSNTGTPGDYTISVANSRNLVDDGEDGGLFASGELRNGGITVGDADFFRFTATSGANIFVGLGETTDTSFYPRALLLGPDGNQVASNFGATAARLDLNAPLPGSYTLIVDDNYRTAAGTYRLTIAVGGQPVTVSPGDEGGPLTSSQMFTGSIPVGDLDVYRITLDIGDTLIAGVGESALSPGFSPALRVLAPAGAGVQTDTGSGVAARAQYRATTAGEHLVFVYDSNTAGTGDYQLTVIDTSSANTAGDNGGPIASGQLVEGDTFIGDLDAFTFTANAGANLLVAAAEITDASYYGRLVLFAPDGSQVASNFGAAAARIDTTATATGTYTVLIDENYRSGSGTYRLNVVIGGVPHTTVANDQGAPLLSGSTHLGEILPGDIDVFTVTLAVNTTLHIEVGEVLGTESMSPLVRLLNPSGGHVATDTGTGSAARIIHRATVAGTFTVLVYDSNTSGGSGNYKLHPVVVPAAQTIDEDGGQLTGGVQVNGSLYKGDADPWFFNATAGDMIVLQLVETAETVSTYHAMNLYGPDGALIASNFGAAGATINHTALVSGVFTVIVGDNYRSGIGTYNLTVSGISGSQAAPQISQHPGNVSVPAGTTALFTAVAVGNPPPTLQWQRSTDGGANWNNVTNGGNFAGATSATLSVSNTTVAMTGEMFRVIASNGVNPNATSNAATLTVTKANQSISFPGPTEKLWGAADFDAAGTATSGLPVSFSIVSGPATINGNTIHLTGVGTVTVRASQAGDANTNAAPDVDRTFNVAKALLTVTADNKSRVYGAANPALTFTITGFVNGEDASVLTGTPALSTPAGATSPVGNYAINAAAGTLTGANYALTFVNGTLAVTKAPLTATADNKSRAYGSANPAFTITYTGFANSETAAVIDAAPTAATTATAASPVGTYAITLTGGTDNNYALALVNGTLSVTKFALTVTADHKSREYGDANPPLTFVISGFVNGETGAVVSGTPVLTTTAVATTPAGTVPINVAAGTLAATNYSFDLVNGTLTITKASVSIVATSAGRIYGSPNPVFAFTANGLKNGETTAVLTGAPSLTTTATAASPVGNYIITAAVGTLVSPNYAFSFVDGMLSVTKSGVFVTADPAARAYGAPDPAFTATITGFVNGDTIAVISGAPNFSTTAVATSPVGTYPITPSAGTLTATNYSFVFASGTLTITQASLNAKADDQSKQQGTANPALTITYSGFVNGENATVIDTPPTASTTAVTASPVGTYPITLLGGADNNYALTLTPGTLTVTTANVAPTITSQPADLTVQVFQGAAFTVATSGVPLPAIQWQRKLAGTTDWVNLTNGNGVAGATSGTLTLTSVSMANSGDQFRAVASNGVNPDATSNAATLTVAKAPATITLGSLGHIYDGTAQNATATTNPSGLAVALTYDGTATAPTNAGTYTIAATINDPNYAGATSGTLSIFKSPLTATADNQAKNQGDANPPLTITYTGLVNNETPAVLDTPPTASTTTTTQSPVGTYPITLTGGTDNNYTLTLVHGVLTVTAGPASPTITQHPADVTVPFGDDAMFIVGATGNPSTLTYQWQVMTPSGGVWQTTGSDQPWLELQDVGGALSGNQYRVIVSNGVLPDATSNPATLTVTKANQTITSQTISAKVYGDAAFPLGDTASSSLPVAYTILSGPATLTDNLVTPTGAGTVTLRTSQAGNADYNAAPDVERSFNVGKATLTVTGENQTRLYGAADPVFTHTYSGFIGADTHDSSVTGEPLCTTTATITSPVGMYPIDLAPGTLAAPNYDFAFVDGTLAITKAPLVVRADDKAKLQGEVNPPLTITYIGLLNNDTSSALSPLPTTATTAVNDSPPGDYPITLSGGAAGNYALTLQNGTLTVTAAAAPPTINEQPRSQTVPLGADVTLQVIASGRAPLSYQWYKNGVLLADATTDSLVLDDVTIDDQASFSVRITNDLGAAVSDLATITIAILGDSPVIIREPADQTVKRGGRARFRVDAEGADPLAYQWYFGLNPLAGETGRTLVVDHVGNAELGLYHVVVSNVFGADTSRDATLALAGRSWRGCFFGLFGGNRGRCAIFVRPDNTAVFCGFERGSRTPIIHRNLIIGDNGHCSFRSRPRSIALPPGVAAAEGDIDVDFTLNDNGTFTGTATGLDLTITGTMSDPNGATAAHTGYFQAGAADTGATSDFIVGPDGQVFVLTTTQVTTPLALRDRAGALAVTLATTAEIDAGFGTIDASGNLVITTEGNGTVTGTVNAAAAQLAATATPDGGAAIALAGANNDARDRYEKLINISTRGQTLESGGVMIPGFVVQGTRAKQILIRCVGPTLGSFGVPGTLDGARLELYSGPTRLAQSEDWGAAANAQALADAARRVFAFDLPFTSRDAVMLVWLEPGLYTLHARGQDGATGVCLVEAYDATDYTNDPPEQRLINISTRGPVGTGANVMIAGFVVLGDVPKRVLIRGVGPGLDQYNVPDTLDDPFITLFDAGNEVVATNDDWGLGNDVAEVQQAAADTQAFAIAVGSKDAALLLNLAPGLYTVHLSGIGGLTGNGIIEVYEVP